MGWRENPSLLYKLRPGALLQLLIALYFCLDLVNDPQVTQISLSGRYSIVLA